MAQEKLTLRVSRPFSRHLTGFSWKNKPCNYLRCCCDKDTSAPCWKGRGNAPVMPLLSGVSGLRATQQTRSDGAGVVVIPRSCQTVAFRLGKWCTFLQNPKTGMCNPWAAGQKWSGSWNFVGCGPRKGPDFQASITVFERYCRCQGRFKGTVGLRLNRYFVKFDKF